MIVPTPADELRTGDLVAHLGLRVRISGPGRLYTNVAGSDAVAYPGVIEESFEGGPSVGREWTIQGRPDLLFAVLVD